MTAGLFPTTLASAAGSTLWHIAADGDPEILDSPDEDEEVIIHGAVHYWRLSFWAVDYDGCCILDFGATHDHASDVLTEYGPGSYLVVDDWDDEGLASLDAVSLADGSPLPEPGWSEREVAR